MSSDKSVKVTISFPWILLTFLVLLGLKLGVGDTAVESWSWWWITSPLWISAAFTVLAMLFVGVLALAAGVSKK